MAPTASPTSQYTTFSVNMLRPFVWSLKQCVFCYMCGRHWLQRWSAQKWIILPNRFKTWTLTNSIFSVGVCRGSKETCHPKCLSVPWHTVWDTSITSHVVWWLWMTTRDCCNQGGKWAMHRSYKLIIMATITRTINTSQYKLLYQYRKKHWAVDRKWHINRYMINKYKQIEYFYIFV